MKKTLLLSVVASTMIMAGGDIAPVEPVVEAPVVEAAPASGWEFAGKGVVYYQTNDTVQISGAGTGDLFSQEASAADAGIQLKATNKDLFAGIGAGVTLNGLATLYLEDSIVSNVMQNPFNGGWIGEAYLTYGTGNTSFKVGRQTLPKSLSPFAYSENWNVFENTFDAALVVNSDLPDTTLVGAYVQRWNVNGVANTFGAPIGDMSTFNKPNSDRGVWMLTAQNKSISDLTLTGSVYYAPDMLTGNDLSILWADVAYNAGTFGVGLQGGTIMSDAFVNDGVLYGAKITGNLMGVNAMAAYSHAEDTFPHQVGGTTSAMYTTTALNQVVGGALTEINSDKYLLGANVDALGGNVAGVFAYTDSDVSNKTTEFDLVYSTSLTENTNLALAYVYADLDLIPTDAINLVRVVGSYKF